nr:MAG: hypothetical protein [Bacteriophage sp.]
MYDYREAMTEDVKEWIKENIDLTEWTEDREGLEQQLNNDLWTEDSITGNASGSYYCNSYKAEESIAHNWNLLNEALDEFGQNNINVIEKGAEWADVIIRCYLLESVISDVLDEMEENGDFDESEE